LIGLPCIVVIKLGIRAFKDLEYLEEFQQLLVNNELCCIPFDIVIYNSAIGLVTK